MVPIGSNRVNLGSLAICLFLGVSGTTFAGESEFQLSPPAVSPIERDRDMIHTTLRDLHDARGLALLQEDDRSAGHIQKILKKWEQDYQPLLSSDPVLKKIDARVAVFFSRSLAGRSHPVSECKKTLMKVPKDKLLPTLTLWLRSLLFRRGVTFSQDLKKLGKADLEDICLQGKALDSRKGLSAWRYRYLAWRYRDTEVRQSFADRDERVAFLTPVHIKKTRLTKASVDAVLRYLAMLRNLKLQVLKDRSMPYDRYRTLEGLMRGVRYMDTIRQACNHTGMDHLMMTRLFIQESEFIHHRVSLAGAFSLAQFLNIALKDIWIFKSRIPGSRILLKGVKSWEDLKKKVIADPRWAIKASCLYMRRLRDEVIMRLGKRGSRTNQATINLMTLEMFALRRSVMEQATLDSLAELARAWPAREMVLFPLLPLGGGVVPDASSMLSLWIERTIREFSQVRISEGVFQGRINRLHSALGLAAYNAGMSNLIKAAKRRAPLAALSFPLQITENRNYVDDILDGTDILQNVDRLASGVMRLDYDGLLKLTREACRLAGVSR